MDTFALGLTVFTNGGISGVLMLKAMKSANVASEGLIQFVPIIISMTSTLSAVSTWSGDGVVQINGHDVFLGRWADWMVTTPLILYIIGLVASAPSNLNFLVMALQGVMIATGFLSAIVHKDSMGLKLILFAFASVVFWMIFWLMIQHLRTLSNLHPNKAKAKKLLMLVITIWHFYPAVTLLGDEFFSVVTRESDFLFSVILDQFAKVGFAIMLFVLHVQQVVQDSKDPTKYHVVFGEPVVPAGAGAGADDGPGTAVEMAGTAS